MLTALRHLLRDPVAALGLLIVVFALFVAIFAPWIAPRPEDAFESNIMLRLRPPSAEFPFGTDDLGRDIFSRVILGTRSALIVAVSVVLAAILIGVPIGLAAGWRDGWLSEVLMRVTDVFLAVPQLILALALGQLLAPGLTTAMVALALTYWPFFARTVFAETRRLRGALFVDALAGIGAHPMRILLLHVLPNAAPAVLVRATIGMGFTILTAALLGFLGVGAAPPTPDWGLAVAEARQHLPDAWWYATFPGLAIMLLVLGFNLLGDGLRDAADPRLRRSRK
ncbi:ABC transporter permease [Roseococcus suduntuyensis]|uniref:Peptide/nickel transport system permease protein n=1 Tax=Roseococcus suduntuyensis TaxID=455361 RepID=A0A840AIB7_9PROT|nr:ABC transporter permease [Roseococcus suduntuyensis]MBB3900333.1 peptide/nickel transport system permease protein [Roseococcus suduntuyensis]